MLLITCFPWLLPIKFESLDSSHATLEINQGPVRFSFVQCLDNCPSICILVVKNNYFEVWHNDTFWYTGSPVNTFEFIRPLLKSLEYDMPKASLPVPTALFIGKACSVIYTIMYPWLNRSWLPQPLLLPAEVYKVHIWIQSLLIHYNLTLFMINHTTIFVLYRLVLPIISIT